MNSKLVSFGSKSKCKNQFYSVLESFKFIFWHFFGFKIIQILVTKESN